MTAHALLDHLRQHGLRIAADGLNIRVRGPEAALTPGVLEAIRRQKSALLALLAAKQEPIKDEPLTPEVTRRAKLFGKQIDAWIAADRIAVPLLLLPDAPEPTRGHCVSCGSTIEEGWRCEACLAAISVALGMTEGGAGR